MAGAAGGSGGEANSDIVVIDNGTGFVKAGYAGTHFPSVVMPSMTGVPQLRADQALLDLGGIELKDVMVGDEAAAVRQALEITHPVENGIIKNWESMEQVWDYTLHNKMELDDLSGKRVLLTEAPMNPKENRARMLEVMFERYGFEGAHVAMQAMLALYAQGLTSGCAVDAGDGVTHVVCVCHGYVPPNCTKRLDIAGRDITRYLIRLLLLRGYSFNRSADFQTIRELKEKLCYVALDTAKERKLAAETTVLVQDYELPDGRKIKIGRERFEASEALFNPELLEVESPGMSDLVFDAIEAADIDMRAMLRSNIVLSGGSTMYPGLPSRLKRDMRNRFLEEKLGGDRQKIRQSKFKVEIRATPQRKHLVFTGAGVLGNTMAKSDEGWVLKADYDEEGMDRLLRAE